jgi:hypothetical protein
MTAASFSKKRPEGTPTNGTPTRDHQRVPLPRLQPGERFLRALIPWWWLDQAGRLPGTALHVALVLWRKAGCHKGSPVRINLSHLGMGVSRKAACRGLAALESARLVSVDRSPGGCSWVTLLDRPLES